MAILAYEIPIDFIPNTDFINTPPDNEYLAWRLSTNPLQGTSLWVINPVVDTPTVTIEDLLDGVDYKEITINDDTNTYGYVRQLLPNESIETVEEEITNQTNLTVAELA